MKYTLAISIVILGIITAGCTTRREVIETGPVIERERVIVPEREVIIRNRY